MEDRKCSDWEEHQETNDPQWHWDLHRTKVLEAERREHAEALARMASDAQAEATMAAKLTAQTTGDLLEIQRGQIRLQEQADKQGRNFNILFVLLAFVAIFLAVAQIGYPNGIEGLNLPGTREDPPPVVHQSPLPTPTSVSTGEKAP